MKIYIIISSLIASSAKALIHLGKRLWFFMCKGKGGRIYVLKEGKEAFLFGLFHLHWKREEGKGGVDHHIEAKGSREGGEGREEGVREEGVREEITFEVRDDGKSWVYENILLEHRGTGYTVYIKGTKEGWEEQDMITCYAPHQLAMFVLLDYLCRGRAFFFSSKAKAKPLQ